MSPVKRLWLLLVFAAAVVGQTVRPPSLQSDIESGLIKLCLGLQKAAAASAAKEENIIFAPLSIAAVLALLLAAADGVTKKELEIMFGVAKGPYNESDLHNLLYEFIFNIEKNHQIETNLVSANGLFPQQQKQGYEIWPSYIEFARNKYQCEVIPVDYRRYSQQSAQFINSWVYNRTEGKIEKILDHFIDSTTSLIIANAFYFKGSWEQPFTISYTKMQNFNVNKQEVIKVPMMVSILEIFYGKSRGKEAVIGLPYKDGDLVMFFVLPEDDLSKYVESLTVESIQKIINQTSRQKTIVAIPKMRVEGNLELSKALQTLGLGSMFNRPTANLLKLGRGTYVSEVVHKVTVEVTEWGTEAAASTSTVINRDGSIPLFRADKPFLFFLYHQKMHAIIFWGTVYRPVS